jgi:hypothetical protein
VASIAASSGSHWFVQPYVSREAAGRQISNHGNIIVLAPELSRAFPTDESVNEALRLVLRMAEIPRRSSKRTAKGG